MPARDVAGGRRGGGGRRRLGARAARAARRRLGGPRHRRPDGQRRRRWPAARHAVLARAGWDVEARGLQGAPWLRVLAGEEAHVTVFNALRLLGLGRDTVAARARRRRGPHARRRARRGAGRLRPPDHRLRAGGQREHGRVRPAGRDRRGLPRARRLVPRRRRVRAVGGGRPAPRAPRRRRGRRRLLGGRRAQVAERPLRLRLRLRGRPGGPPGGHAPHGAPTWPRPGAGERNGADWAPEASRRARAFPVWAALRFLGRDGVAELVERCCALAARIAGAAGRRARAWRC